MINRVATSIVTKATTKNVNLSSRKRTRKMWIILQDCLMYGFQWRENLERLNHSNMPVFA